VVWRSDREFRDPAHVESTTKIRGKTSFFRNSIQDGSGAVDMFVEPIRDDAWVSDFAWTSTGEQDPEYIAATKAESYFMAV
jgi:hypothetical protein